MPYDTTRDERARGARCDARVNGRLCVDRVVAESGPTPRCSTLAAFEKHSATVAGSAVDLGVEVLLTAIAKRYGPGFVNV